MIKKVFIFFYRSLIEVKSRLINFIIPNLWYIRRIDKIKIPHCQQRTIIRGKGRVQLGESCRFGDVLGGFHRGGCIELQSRYKNALIIIGDKVATNNNIFICAANNIEIGRETLIGQGVTIMDFEAHGINPKKRRGNNIKIGEVKIGENVWIGNNVLILCNTVIGNNSIIAAGAVVKGIFPENVIIGGVPAKIIKKLDFEG